MIVTSFILAPFGGIFLFLSGLEWHLTPLLWSSEVANMATMKTGGRYYSDLDWSSTIGAKVIIRVYSSITMTNVQRLVRKESSGFNFGQIVSLNDNDILSYSLASMMCFLTKE